MKKILFLAVVAGGLMVFAAGCCSKSCPAEKGCPAQKSCPVQKSCPAQAR